jgi:transcription elongation GreA/GreB family factor
MDKGYLVGQLAEQLRAVAQSARASVEAALADGQEGATPAERREDARVAQQSAGLARGHRVRLARATAELAELERFVPPPAVAVGKAVTLGAIVEIESGEHGRTFFLAPVGAGMELTVPEGDGYLSVVTPSSPIGKAVMGRRLGDEFELELAGVARTWSITYIG